MSRIKVVFSIGAMHGGGSERQLVSLLRHLDRKRFEPVLYLIYRSGPLLQELPADVPVFAFEERFRKSSIYLPGLMHRNRVRDMSKFLKEVRADISYDRTFLMTLIAADAAQRINVPNVSTVVTDPSLGFKPVAGKFQSTKRRILKRLYSSSGKVLANSEGAARSAEAFYGLKPDSVFVHYNGVDLDAVKTKSELPIDDDWWNEDKTDRSLRLVTAGRLNREKGFHLLIDAVAELVRQDVQSDIKLAILGEGDSRDNLQAQIDQFKLNDSIRLVGFRDNAPAWYKSADIFVLPSFLEGMPNVLLEAMAVGTDVVSTDCPSGPKEILQDGEYGVLVDVGSADSLVSGIRQVINSQKKTAQAVSRVESEFSIQSATRNLEDILSEVVESHQPS